MRYLLSILACSLGSVAVADDYVTIKGQVKWNAPAAPKLLPIAVGAGLRPAGAPPLLPTDILVDPKSLGFKNVIVWLRPDNEDRASTFPVDKVKSELKNPKPMQHVVDVVDFQFEPRVVAAKSADTLKFANTSMRAINLNYFSDGESWNLLIPARGLFELKNPLATQRAPIPFSCNINPWMMGRVRVFDHPYFAITDKNGNFEIKDAPVGKWRIVYCHESGYHEGHKGLLGFPVDVVPEKPGGSTMELKPLAFEIVQPK